MITKIKQTLSKVLAPILISTTVFSGFGMLVALPETSWAGGTAWECYNPSTGYGWNYQATYSNSTLSIYKTTTTGSPVLVDSYAESEFNSNHSGQPANSFALDKDGFGYVVKKDNNAANYLYQISPGGSPEFLGLLGGNDYNAATIFHNNNHKYYLAGKGMSTMTFVRFASDGSIAKTALVNMINNTTGATLRKAKDFAYLPSTFNKILPNGQRADIVGFDNESNRLIMGSIAIFNQGTSSESMSITFYSEYLDFAGIDDFGAVSAFNDKIFIYNNTTTNMYQLNFGTPNTLQSTTFTMVQSSNTDGASCNDLNFTSTNITITAPTVTTDTATCSNGSGQAQWTFVNNDNSPIFIEVAAFYSGVATQLQGYNGEIPANGSVNVFTLNNFAHNAQITYTYKFSNTAAGLVNATTTSGSITINCPTFTLDVIQGLNDVTDPTAQDGSGCATAYVTVTNNNAVTLYVEARYTYNGTQESYLVSQNIPAGSSYTFTSTRKLTNNLPFIWNLSYKEAGSSTSLSTLNLSQMTLDCPTTTTTTTGTNVPFVLFSLSGISSLLLLGRLRKRNA